jgi:hypothetical protein
MSRIIVVMLANLVLFSTMAQGQARARYGMVLYDPPAGWTATDKDDLHILTAPGRNSFLVFLPAKPLDSTLDKAAAELLSPEKARPGYAEGSTRISGRHNGSGGQWLAITYLYADPNHRGQYLSNWLVLIAGGGQFATLTLISTNSTAFNTDDKAVRRLIDGIKLTTMIQVEPGNPPLTRYLLDETNDFLEWLMQVPLTDAQKATIEREIRGIWRKNDRKEMDGVYEVLKGRQQIAALQPAQRDLVRQSALDDVIKQWRAEKNSPATKMMVEIYDTAHKPIAAGTPPLTRQNVDAFTEFLCFTAGQTAGVNFTPSAEARDKLAAAVAENYAGMAPSQRALIARMPVIWASLRVLWPQISDAEKKQFVDTWKKDPQLVELGRQFQAAAGSSDEAQATSQAATRSQAAAPSQTAARSQGSTPSQGGSGLRPETKASLAQLQMQMDRQKTTYNIMSNIMRIQHETNMTIVNNMGPGDWHYEYRSR